MYKHLFVPVDGSELSHRAMEGSIALAAQLGARTRKELHTPEKTAHPAPSHSATTSPWPLCGGQTANSAARITAPVVCPVNRAVPSMPLAAPLRCKGAVVTMVWLLGD